jgi:hypothetical protein
VSAALAIAFGVPQAWASRMGMNMKMLETLRYSGFEAAHTYFPHLRGRYFSHNLPRTFSHSGVRW